MKISRMKAFTLVELLVVLAILVILIAILVPNLDAYIDDAKTTAANASAKQIHSAAQQFMLQAQIAGKATIINGQGKQSGIDMNRKVVQLTAPTGTTVSINKINGYSQFTSALKNYISEKCGVGSAVGSYYALNIDKNGNVLDAAWVEDRKDPNVGTYPKQRDASQNKYTSNNKSQEMITNVVNEWIADAAEN